MNRPLSLILAGIAAIAITGCGDDAPSGTTRAGEMTPETRIAIDRLETNLRERVAAGRAPAMVAGVLLPDGTTRVIAAGDIGDGRAPDADTVFEIGSITKTFTATALADMAARGEVALDDPVGGLLPGWRIPERGGPIRLVDLATQSSGLPRELPDIAAGDPGNPWAHITPAQMRAFLDTHGPARAQGGAYEYSNVGYGLLGVALATRSGVTYERLVRDRILTPLGMADSGIDITPRMRERLAVGHDVAGEPTPPLVMDAIAGAGALRSTTADMLRYAAANLGGDGRLAGAMRDAQTSRRDAGPGMRIGLAWHVVEGPAGDVAWHNGGTIGFRSFIAIDRARGLAVVVWANAAADVTDDIGFNFLDPGAPLAPAPVKRTAIRLPAEVLERYVGVYRLPGMRVTITRGPEHLIATPEGQGPVPLYAESTTEFFLTAVDAQVTFRTAPDGRVIGLTLHQNGADVNGNRVP